MKSFSSRSVTLLRYEEGKALRQAHKKSANRPPPFLPRSKGRDLK